MASTPKDIDRLYGLEPVLEPGEDSPGGAPECFIDVGCPYCSELINVRVDLSAGAQSYIEDCQVCCQPIMLSLTVTEEGRFRELSAERLDQ